MFRHLTNYALNKKHRAYVKTNNESDGSKRSFAFLEAYLRQRMDVGDPQIIWRRIRNLIVKTMILGAPHIYHGYRLFHRSGGRPARYPPTTLPPVGGAKGEGGPQVTGGGSGGILSAAFEILGFDILLDKELRPWLIEVNRSPSFGVDQGLDLRVKSSLLRDTLKLLNIK